MNCFIQLLILQNGHIDVVKLIIKVPEIDVNVKDIYGQTPLHKAAKVSYINL